MSALNRTQDKRTQNLVRVGVRNGAIVKIKRCRLCEQDKICSEDRRESEFSPCTRRPDGSVASWLPICKTCNAERSRHLRRTNKEKVLEYHRTTYRNMKADPEKAAIWRDQKREEQRRRRAARSPETRRREAMRQEKWRQRKRREDPAYFTAARRKERLVMQAANVTWFDKGGNKHLDARPFAAWLIEYRSVMNLGVGCTLLAENLGIPERRLSGVVNGGSPNVSLDVIDAALQAANTVVHVDSKPIFTVNDLYQLEETG